MASNRKLKENLGKAYADGITDQFDGPETARARTGIAGIELMLLQILKEEFRQMAEIPAKRERYCKHLFDPVAGAEYRRMVSESFALRPPTAILGYARQGTEMPCVAIILGDEQESRSLLGHFVGETMPEETGDVAEYLGAFWDHNFPLWVYSENAIVTAGLYQITKMILFGASVALEHGGFIEMSLSGMELGPGSEYVPEHIYARVLSVKGKSVFTVPEYTRDPGKYRLQVHSDDVIVDGIRGGVHGVPPETGD